MKGLTTVKKGIATIGALCAASLPIDAAMAQQPTFESVLKGAKAEGAITIWASAPQLPETQKAMIAAFNKRFGLDTKAEWVSINAVRANTRMLAEAPSGKVSFDIVFAGQLEEVGAVAEKGAIKAYPWVAVFGKEIPALEARVNEVIPELRGMALPSFDAVYGIAWNPTLIKDADVPSKLTELTDPKWKGKFAFNSFYLVPLDSTSNEMGRAQTVEFAKKMVDNLPVYENGTPAVSRAITAGSVPMGVTTFHTAERAAQLGEPQKFKLFADYIPIGKLHMYIPENGPHPNTTRLFAAWAATEGVKIGNATEPLPVATDPNTKIGKMIKAQVDSSGAKVATPRSMKDVEAGLDFRKKVSVFLTGQAAK